MSENVKPRIRLADAIAELRAEIDRAKRDGEGKDVRFAAKAIEVELSIDFGWSAEVNAGAPKWIPFIDLAAKGAGSEKSLHKIKVTLEIDAQGDSTKGLIGDTRGPAPVKPSM